MKEIIMRMKEIMITECGFLHRCAVFCATDILEAFGVRVLVSSMVGMKPGGRVVAGKVGRRQLEVPDDGF